MLRKSNGAFPFYQYISVNALKCVLYNAEVMAGKLKKKPSFTGKEISELHLYGKSNSKNKAGSHSRIADQISTDTSQIVLMDNEDISDETISMESLK